MRAIGARINVPDGWDSWELSSGDLLFCGHHAKAYEDKLKESAVDWVDETASLHS